jgi:phosphoglycolate phosphatase
VLDAVLFDLDGTLTDPAAGITGSLRIALAEVGRPVPDDVDLTWVIGPAIRESVGRLGVPAAEQEAVVEAYRTHLRAVGLFQATLVEGIVDVLDGLRADGVRLALATAKMIEMGEATLAHFGLLDRFEVVAGTFADGATRSKAQIVGDALEGLGVPDPARTAMVGDRHHDVEGARAHGCTAIAVGWGFAQPGELEAHPPDHVVDRPEELLAVLRSLGAER